MTSPQWSPLLKSGMTPETSEYKVAVVKPQWSPLLKSGMTQHHIVMARIHMLAAMEPAPEERDDAFLCGHRARDLGQPQWSPLLKSGMTRTPPRLRHVGMGRNGARS